MSYKRVCITVLLVIPDQLLNILRLFSIADGRIGLKTSLSSELVN